MAVELKCASTLQFSKISHGNREIRTSGWVSPPWQRDTLTGKVAYPLGWYSVRKGTGARDTVIFSLP